jgi:formate-dependent nitrite reductase membrane component NrfD
MIPAAVLVVAALGFWRQGERRRVVTTLVVLALLLASLGTALLVTPPG